MTFGTELPYMGIAYAYTASFAADAKEEAAAPETPAAPAKEQQRGAGWAAFLRRIAFEAEPGFWAAVRP